MQLHATTELTKLRSPPLVFLLALIPPPLFFPKSIALSSISSARPSQLDCFDGEHPHTLLYLTQAAPNPLVARAAPLELAGRHPWPPVAPSLFSSNPRSEAPRSNPLSLLSLTVLSVLRMVAGAAAGSSSSALAMASWARGREEEARPAPLCYLVGTSGFDPLWIQVMNGGPSSPNVHAHAHKPSKYSRTLLLVIPIFGII